MLKKTARVVRDLLAFELHQEVKIKGRYAVAHEWSLPKGRKKG